MKYAIFIKKQIRNGGGEHDIWEAYSSVHQTLFSEKEFQKLYPKLYHTHGKEKIKAFREVDIEIDTKLKVTEELS